MGVFKLTEWESTSSGQWYCNDVSNLAGGSGDWWNCARACNLSPADFIKMLIKDFHPDNFYFSEDKCFISYSWNSQVDMRKFKNYINAQARKNNFNI